MLGKSALIDNKLNDEVNSIYLLLKFTIEQEKGSSIHVFFKKHYAEIPDKA